MSSRLLFNVSDIVKTLSTNHPKLKTILQKNNIQPVKKIKNEDLYELKPIVTAWIKEATERKNETLDRNAEDARLKAAQADLKEIELAQRKGELLERELVESDIADILVIVRNKLLVMPEILTALVYGVDDRLKTKSLIRTKINETLDELSRLGDTVEKTIETISATTSNNG